MIYRTFKGEKLSALGFGMMRLPVVNGDGNNIDEDAARAMVCYALEHGINYFDTAFGYHGGNSEIVTGKLLAEHPRDSFYLATKFPGSGADSRERTAEVFEKQLEKCKVDYFDFYLLHNVNDGSADGYAKPDNASVAYLKEQKSAGRIRHLGFSAHISYDAFERFLAARHDDMEFCQLQLNYLDWTFQDAKKKVDLLTRYGIPVWVMEPLRGGRLARLDDKYVSALKDIRADETVPSFAFRFIQSLPQVCVTLSGMSSMEQLKDNLATFEADKPLTTDEFDKLTAVAADMMANTVPCTSCRYCVSKCPVGLDIPRLLGIYNEATVTAGGFNHPWGLRHIDEDKQPSCCLGCGACAAACPQNIKIPEVFADFSEKLKQY